MLTLTSPATTRTRAPFGLRAPAFGTSTSTFAVGVVSTATPPPVRPWRNEAGAAMRPLVAVRPFAVSTAHLIDAVAGDLAGAYSVKQGSPPRGAPR